MEVVDHFTIVYPTIGNGDETTNCLLRPPTPKPEEKPIPPNDPEDPKPKNKDSILVVGRLGSGKSTFLNTLAGVYWTLRDGQFAVNENAKAEIFPTSRSVKGCTTAADLKSVDSFDGRQLTVIDTVGYDDNVNAENFYNTSNLTEVMNQHDGISALVIVMNFKDPRLTQGFVESLVCVPKSFKKRVQQNVVLVYTNCTAEDLEEGHDEYGDELHAEHVTVVRKALGFEESDDHITFPIFCMDNRKFKKCNDNARHTIENLQNFLDCVTTMPELSCKTFKEMRALSQFERAVRKAIQQYFQPSSRDAFEKSNRDVTKMSGFEDFLYKRSLELADDISKLSFDISQASLTRFTAADWAKELYDALLLEVIDKLPREIKKNCDEVDLRLGANQFRPSNTYEATAADKIAKGLIVGGAAAIFGTAGFSFGLSLEALPGCAVIAYVGSQTWHRQDVICEVVFNMSKAHAKDLQEKCTSQFTAHVDQMVKGIQECFEIGETRE